MVVAPTYNHAESLRLFLPRLEACGLPCIVIDDGSTDESAKFLEAWRSEAPALRTVIRHAQNLGKAAALQTGFAHARQVGCTHALTIDTDGQHDVEDIGALLEQSRREPDKLVIGARDARTPGYPIRSRVGRTISNFLVWLESGQNVSDSQSGMRIYPLAAIASAKPGRGWAARYGFETQVLTRLGMRGIGCAEVPIRCVYQPREIGRTHFRVIEDSSRAVAMHARLLIEAHGWGPPAQKRGTALLGTLPRRLLWWFAPRRVIAMARGAEVDRKALAASVGCGAFMAFAPLYGVKTVCCLWLAKRFSLHPLVVVAVSSVSSPPLGLFFIAASIVLGHAILNQTVAGAETWNALVSTLRGDTGGPLTRLRGLVAEWVVGGFVGGALVGLAAYALCRCFLRRGVAQSAKASN